MIKACSCFYSRRHYGFSLVELMVALVLGLIVVGAVVSVFISNRQMYELSEELSRTQENQRVSFEVFSRDIRHAGGLACGTKRIVNVVSGLPLPWWLDFAQGPVQGYGKNEAFVDVPFGNQYAERIDGTDAFIVRHALAGASSVLVNHDSVQNTFNLKPFLGAGVWVVCDQRIASVFWSTGNACDIRNTTCNLGPEGTAYTYLPGSQINHIYAAFWYVGSNGRGGRSLFRRFYPGTGAGPITEEVVENVNDMVVTYLFPGGRLEAAPLPNDLTWSNVKAMRVTLGFSFNQTKKSFSVESLLRNALL